MVVGVEVREVAKCEKPKVTRGPGNANRYFGNENAIRKRVCANGECSMWRRNLGGVTVGKLRGAEIYNLEEGAEVAQNELTELNNRTEVSNKEELRK